MPEFIAYQNGEYVPYNQCKIHVSDKGFTNGYVVFDTERTFNGKVFRLHDHMERLFRSLKVVRINPKLSLEQLEQLTLDLVERNKASIQEVGDVWVNQIITRGQVDSILDDSNPTVIIRIYPIDFAHYARSYQTGAHVVFPQTRSYDYQALDPRVKNFDRLNFGLAHWEAADVDPKAYPVLLDLDGNITESYAANFFLVSRGVLRTPGGRGFLEGVTRMTTLELAKELGIPTSEQDLTRYDAYTAEEAFLTTSSFCVLPVSHIDKRPIGQQVPGPITKKLLKAWSDRVGLDVVDQALSFAKLKVASQIKQ